MSIAFTKSNKVHFLSIPKIFCEAWHWLAELVINSLRSPLIHKSQCFAQKSPDALTLFFCAAVNKLRKAQKTSIEVL